MLLIVSKINAGVRIQTGIKIQSKILKSWRRHLSIHFIFNFYRESLLTQKHHDLRLKARKNILFFF